MVGMFVAVGCEEKSFVADIAAPAAELGGFVVAQGNPETVVGQLLQALRVDMWCGGQRGAHTERQPGKAFEHSWLLGKSKIKTERGPKKKTRSSRGARGVELKLE